MTRIELVNLILTKDALYRLSYISVANEEYSIRKLFVWQAFLTNFLKLFFEDLILTKDEARFRVETGLIYLIFTRRATCT